MRIEIVERFPNIWIGHGSYSAHNCTKHVRLSRKCSVLDARGFHLCWWMQQQRFDSKVLIITKFRLIFYIKIWQFSWKWTSLLVPWHSVSLLAPAEHYLVPFWRHKRNESSFGNGSYSFLKSQNYDNSSFRLWMTSLYLRTTLEFRCVVVVCRSVYI